VSGIFLIAIALGWLLVSIVASWKLSCIFPQRRVRALTFVALAVILVVLPVADELIARPKFVDLCKREAVAVLDDRSPMAKTAKFGSPSTATASIWPLRATVTRHQFIDPATSRPVFHYGVVNAKGGALMRLLRLTDSQAPLLFPPSCTPPEFVEFDKWLQRNSIIQIPS
jgi:hypothetical protein